MILKNVNVSQNDKDEALRKVRYHWYSYVARGGFNQPKAILGTLEEGGLKHWTLFLQLGRKYLLDYPKDQYILEGFVPKGMIKMLTGE